MDKAKIAGLILSCAGFLLAMAVMDFSAMHYSYAQTNPNLSADEWLYKYWISYGIVVFFAAFTISYAVWLAGAKKQICLATFATITLLFIGGLQDIFYGTIATLRGEAYNFQYWSAQYKWFVATKLIPDWTWTHQIIWFLTFLTITTLIWHHILKKR
ncbi:MAG: hypothetical protein QXR76_03435 [Candidatus Bathyarchaeia archaeon]